LADPSIERLCRGSPKDRYVPGAAEQHPVDREIAVHSAIDGVLQLVIGPTSWLLTAEASSLKIAGLSFGLSGWHVSQI